MYDNKQTVFEEKQWRIVGSYQQPFDQPLDHSPYALQTELFCLYE